MTTTGPWARWLLCAVLATGCAEAHDARTLGDTGPEADGGPSIALARSPFGGPCETDARCADGMVCLTTLRGADPACPGDLVFPGGYCATTGTTGAGEACPAGSLGELIGTCDFDLPTVFVCLAPCATDADCRTGEGYRCVAAFTGSGGCSAD